MKAYLMLSAFLLAACSTQQPGTSQASSRSIGRFLVQQELPSKVKKAVGEVSKLGREEGDFFGIQRFEAYSIPSTSAQQHLKAIVADVIEATRAHGQFSLADFCLNGEDEQGEKLVLEDDNECAAYLIGHARRPRFDRVAQSLRDSYSFDSSEGQRMNKALDHIQKFVGKAVGGDDQEELSISMAGLNVSEETVVLINKAKGHVVIFKFDQGA